MPRGKKVRRYYCTDCICHVLAGKYSWNKNPGREGKGRKTSMCSHKFAWFKCLSLTEEFVLLFYPVRVSFPKDVYERISWHDDASNALGRIPKVLSSYLECLYYATSRTTRRRDGTEIERLGNVLKVIFLFNNVSGRMSLSAFSFRRIGSDDFFVAYIECIKSWSRFDKNVIRKY